MDYRHTTLLFVAQFLICVIVEAKYKRPLIEPNDLIGSTTGCPEGIEPRIHCPFNEGEADNWTCIRYSDLCNGRNDCPHGEDETASMCIFHAYRKQQVKNLKTILDELQG